MRSFSKSSKFFCFPLYYENFASTKFLEPLKIKFQKISPESNHISSSIDLSIPKQGTTSFRSRSSAENIDTERDRARVSAPSTDQTHSADRLFEIHDWWREREWERKRETRRRKKNGPINLREAVNHPNKESARPETARREKRQLNYNRS